MINSFEQIYFQMQWFQIPKIRYMKRFMLTIILYHINTSIFMKIKFLLMIPLFIIMQVDGCDTDDEVNTNDGTENNFVTFQGTTNDPIGGCNIQSDAGLDISCNYLANYQLDGLNYGIAITNNGVCRTATFNMSNNFEETGDALFVLQITDNGVPIESFVGVSGTIDLVDSGANSSMSFEGSVISLNTGITEPIEGFIKCPL